MIATVAHVRRALTATAFAIVAMGCVLLPSGPTVVTLRGPDGSYELPVALYDPAGLITTVEAAAPDTAGPNASLTQVDADSAILQWLGGACDKRAQINVHAQDRAISLAVRTDEAFGACPALGIPRAVTLTFREPIGDRMLELAGGT